MIDVRVCITICILILKIIVDFNSFFPWDFCFVLVTDFFPNYVLICCVELDLDLIVCFDLVSI
jgi:hypothetical protein